MKARHIVVVNFTRMGVLIQSGPLLRSLVESNPDGRLTLIVFEKFRDAAAHLPMVDTVLGFDVDGLAPRLASKRGDLAEAYAYMRAFLQGPMLQDVDEIYNLSHTPLSATLCHLVRAKKIVGLQRTASGRITLQGDWFTYLFSIMRERRLNPFNLVEICNRMNPALSGKHHLEFTITADDRRAAREMLSHAGIEPNERYVVLQPGASSAIRQWPARSFGELSKRFAGAGLRTVLVGSKEERTLSETVLASADGKVVTLAGLTDIGTLAAVLSGGERLVSNDTGTIHLAAAVQTPAIGLYVGPASAKDTAPYGDGHIIIEPDLPCAPCGYHHACHDLICHRSISVEQVFALAMSPACDVERVSAGMQGIRVMRTAISDTGAFVLQRLNSPLHNTDDALVECYRAFWMSLLGEADSRNTVFEPKWRDAVEELRGICQCARQALNELRREASRVHPDPATLTTRLKSQAVWHESLRRFAERYPLLAPLPRFLLVRITTMHAENIAQFIKDAEATARLFERGVELLATVCESRPEAGRIYAAAV